MIFSEEQRDYGLKGRKIRRCEFGKLDLSTENRTAKSKK